MRKRRMSFARREALSGLFFMAPALIGILVFLAYPLVTSLLLSFGGTDRNAAGLKILFSGFDNYARAFITDTKFVPRFLGSIRDVVIETPLIIVFSLLIAILLEKIRYMKGFFRVVFVLPFLIGAGNVLQQLMNTGIDKEVLTFSGSALSMGLTKLLGSDVVAVIDLFFGRIVSVLWGSSIQILLFLSAIQSINPSMLEAARMDGATEYDIFWKITLPSVLPILLLNTVYTIINSFTSSENPLLDYIKNQSVILGDHGFAAAMGWIYFAFVLVFIGLVTLVINKCIRATYSSGGKRQ